MARRKFDTRKKRYVILSVLSIFVGIFTAVGNAAYYYGSICSCPAEAPGAYVQCCTAPPPTQLIVAVGILLAIIGMVVFTKLMVESKG